MALTLNDLRVGSLVRLACGSPKMAVIGFSDCGLVKALWWSDRLGILTDQFDPAILVWPRPPEAAREPVEARDAADA